MKPIDLIAYVLMFIASVGWSMILYGQMGVPRLLSIGLGVVLGPVTVILSSYVITEYFTCRKE